MCSSQKTCRRRVRLQVCRAALLTTIMLGDMHRHWRLKGVMPPEDQLGARCSLLW